MGFIVVTERGKQGSYYYELRNKSEAKYLGNALSLVDREGLQVVQLGDIDIYGEYAPYTKVDTVADLFLLVGGLAKRWHFYEIECGSDCVLEIRPLSHKT